MNFVPNEFEFIGAYWPPMLYALALGTIAMLLTVRFVTPRRLARYFVYPEGVMLAMIAIYTVIISTFVIPS